jgi:succinoglycan biosynthesis transport protein ExoP
VEFRQVLALAWRRRWLVALVAGLSVGVGALVYTLRPQTYGADVKFAVTPKVYTSAAGSSFLPGADTISTLLQTFAALAASDANVGQAESDLGRPLPGDVHASADVEHAILTVSGQGDTPQAAATTAGAAANAFSDLAPTRLVRIQQLNEPTAPSQPLPPGLPLVLGVAGALGLLGGVLAALLAEQLRRRIDSGAEASAIAGAPVIGHVPKHASLGRGTHVVWDQDSAGQVAEQFRDLRTNVELVLSRSGESNGSDRSRSATGLRRPGERSSAVIQVTSASAQQGKSVIAANLSVAFAQAGERTLVIDADLRHPTQHEYFDLPGERGLASLLTGEASAPFEVIQSTRFERLELLAAGSALPAAVDQLHLKLGRILELLTPHYNTIVLDSPPLLAIGDGQSVGTHASGVFLVVMLGDERASALRQAVRRLDVAGRAPSGIVANRVSALPKY